jgi:hypothetical protein
MSRFEPNRGKQVHRHPQTQRWQRWTTRVSSKTAGLDSTLESPRERLTIKLPPMTTGSVPLRRSGRNRTGSILTQNSPPSTSEYHESERSTIDDNPPFPESEHVIKLERWGRSSRGRKVKKNNYKESGSEDDMRGRLDIPEDLPVNGKAEPDMDDDDDDDEQPRRTVRSRSSRIPRQATRFTSSATDKPGRMTRASSRAIAKSDDYVDVPSEESDEADGSLGDAPHTSSDLEADADAEGEPDFDAEGEPDLEVQDDGRPYSLRQRTKVNYAIPPPIEETKPPPKSRPTNRNGARTRRGPGWSATGTELSRWMGMPVDDSVRDPMLCSGPVRQYSLEILGLGHSYPDT